MLIRLVPEKIVENVYSEEQLADLSVLESIYAIRALKAAIMTAGKQIEVDAPGAHGQVFLKEFDIWIGEDCYETLIPW